MRVRRGDFAFSRPPSGKPEKLNQLFRPPRVSSLTASSTFDTGAVTTSLGKGGASHCKNLPTANYRTHHFSCQAKRLVLSSPCASREHSLLRRQSEDRPNGTFRLASLLCFANGFLFKASFDKEN